MEHSLGTQLPLFSAIPFVGMLLSIALGPVLFSKFWHHHFGKVSAAWAALLAIPLIVAFGKQGVDELLHLLIVDYIPFIILIGSLFTVGGGILVRTTLKGTTWVNASFLTVGAIIASWMGTTGAAMLLIRPFLRVNKDRKYRAFMVVFFIFMVANVGGALTPLGDPPLFLGFLHGVPFFWTLRLITPMIVVLLGLLLIYIAFDKYYLAKEQKEGSLATSTGDRLESQSPSSSPATGKRLEILGSQNFILLAVIIGVILFSGYVKMSEVSILGVHLGWQDLIRNIVLVAIIVLSMKITPKALREENEYSWGPILEIVYLFFGIFVTMAPVLAILKAGESGALSFITNAVKEPTQYFWITGALSSFLDNAPTYLTFFSTALGQFYPGVAEAPAVAQFLVNQPIYLLAISAGSVFFGAVTYIGNAPNFMVRSIAEESGVKMPSFFGYMVYSICILLPLFALVTWLFFF
ncbi:Na+/H+ antiporter NhaD-like permease [Desulfitobacterium dichloroeliminans LMG P-21439]|uniref:Na+/H+ antiporter NhaD-like permease n=1 Tax=Desulfitobacterium dichloroeliminans (strain LMG P-21439 / DCA1) TaxID=871963 RepID=L0F414_DESDL|nr:sodium:proton antiporter [Desulfitobacterium dichloroeliminans]AGA68554.1 Na+/H+ antiporter NhaD-like permease [Desulfitobacterium dichloroeliminans LMG P-21439]